MSSAVENFRLDYAEGTVGPNIRPVEMESYRSISDELESDFRKRSYRAMTYIQSVHANGDEVDKMIKTLLYPILIPADRLAIERK